MTTTPQNHLTERFDEALVYASRIHRDQRRKGADIPYISHLLGVAAIAIENASEFGNAAVIYTQDGDAAQRFTEGARSGMVGVNVGVPVPREPFGFGGWNASRFGAGDITGTGSISFWTQAKKITSHWIHTDEN